MSEHAPVLRRWRLLLGQYAAPALGAGALSAEDWRLEQSLDYLYGREYEQRGLARGADLGAQQLRAVDWLNRVRKLFPTEVYERLQTQALDRYGLTELLRDPATLAALEPNQALARTLLSLRGRMSAELRGAVRTLIRQVVADITARLRPAFVAALTGRRNRFARSQLASAQNFDWRATIDANLKHYDRERRQLVIERPRFNARVRRQLPWDVILCVDQSGSMVDSIMHAAISAGILASLPGVTVRIVVFDTKVVDLSHLAHDPVEVLLTMQLGGGTDIGRALRYCETLVRNPRRTILALISDFCEGAAPAPLLQSVRRLREARVRLLGLAALDSQQHPIHDLAMAQRLAQHGMEVAALTPVHFAQWLGEVIQ